MADKVERQRDSGRDRDWVIRSWKTGGFARTLAGSAPEAKLAQYEHYVQELTRDGLQSEAGSNGGASTVSTDGETSDGSGALSTSSTAGDPSAPGVEKGHDGTGPGLEDEGGQPDNLRFQEQQVSLGQQDQPPPDLDDFLREAQAKAPLFAGMIVIIMPEASSGQVDMTERSSKSWGLVAADHQVVTIDGGGGTGAGDGDDKVMIKAPRTGARALRVERSRVANSTAYQGMAMEAWAAAEPKANALTNLSTAASHEAYREEVREAGGLWTPDEVSAALEAATQLRSLDDCYHRREKCCIKVPDGKKNHHLVDFCRRFKRIPR
ncbi:hypothetical protein Esi_0240_0017 [Ectocarpus siliculosus]|uniref:Uncharacterized protein n=1 Tax=Ectocarpus siliculosus TaxID=2880 RepID=D7FSU6_ECTSI|nr:hypothetical protein Esi_0240_0017 [Ectocarpus siliculosus]|eukprot:CBJ31237.1 hypothetical protein Esi_0240_0017 [Ectocarpus siliculosus]